MSIAWFVVWLIANNVGGNEPLTFDPVNAWLATLILAVALDVNRLAAIGPGARKPPERPAADEGGPNVT